ncbi:RNA polymerase subunit sigma-70 [Sporosarcina sp. P16b]|uniref:RNA polymerase subunit sigma-70 n=1 Tax=Sporosarcina sp. P16b TaxID=2048261 RepID=UPI0011818538|nr:RNA polymerase subunit sigma-70 [Sporosarcina sp. P16b]
MGNAGNKEEVQQSDGDLRAAIQQGLLGQLREQQNDGPYFLNLVDDYMAFWDIKSGLIQDVQKRGVMVKWKNGEKQSGHKKNDSISELIRVNTQMMKILQQLNIKAAMLHEDPVDDY